MSYIQQVYPTIAHNLWQYYGAVGVVQDHWLTLKLYVNFLEQVSRDLGPSSPLPISPQPSQTFSSESVPGVEFYATFF